MISILQSIKFLRFGWAEFLLALVPVLGSYSRGIVHLNMFSCILVAIICFFREQRKWCPTYYLFFILFIVIHELLLCLTMDKLPLYHINGLIDKMTYMIALIFIPAALNTKKYIRATYFIGVIVSAGMLYHVLKILSGSFISPIPFPIVASFFEMEKMKYLLLRPTSFFDEPSVYANYMMIPMFFMLREKKYIWYAISAIFVLLSTSTTGVIGVISLLGLNMLVNLNNKRMLIFSFLIIGGVVYGLSHLSVFSETTEKIETTDVSTNNRMSNGPLLIKHISPEELIFGINASNTVDYVRSHPHLFNYIYTYSDEEGETDSFFVSTFWDTIIKYGVFGFFLYYFVYFKIIREDINLLPLIGSFGLFSIFGGLGISSMFVFVFSTAIMIGMEDRKMIIKKQNESRAY